MYSTFVGYITLYYTNCECIANYRFKINALVYSLDSQRSAAGILATDKEGWLQFLPGMCKNSPFKLRAKIFPTSNK